MTTYLGTLLGTLSGLLLVRLVVRKTVFGIFDLVPHKPDCTSIEDGERLEISDLGRRGIVLSV